MTTMTHDLECAVEDLELNLEELSVEEALEITAKCWSLDPVEIRRAFVAEHDLTLDAYKRQQAQLAEVRDRKRNELLEAAQATAKRQRARFSGVPCARFGKVFEYEGEDYVFVVHTHHGSTTRSKVVCILVRVRDTNPMWFAGGHVSRILSATA